MINFNAVSIKNVVSEVSRVFEKSFGIKPNESRVETALLQTFLDKLNDDLYVVLEFPYVDKLHRDSFYTYFATKRFEYNRNTIRLCFFNKKVKVSDFSQLDKVSFLQSSFKGFLVLRPLRKVIGRNILSPTIFKEKDFSIRSAKYEVFINAVRLTVEGFPHASQDTEAMTCAETTLWSLMEYFGSKYNEYSTVLPSKIRDKIKNYNVEGQLPSKGLTIREMSYLVKDFGFSGKIYSRDIYYNKTTDSYLDYYKLLHCYIDSGIPVILGIQGNGIGHAMICIGREKEIGINIDSCKTTLLRNGERIIDYHGIERNIIVIDDNASPYQKTTAENITGYYESDIWKGCKISYFLVPLYSKIYLEAFKARACLFSFLATDLVKLPKDKKIIVRLFLTSSKSLKHNLHKNKSFNKDLKELIIKEELPKFTWVCELSDEDLILKSEANGLVLMDATEGDHMAFKPIILSVINNTYLFQNKKTFYFEEYDLPLQPFSVFTDNLKSY